LDSKKRPQVITTSQVWATVGLIRGFRSRMMLGFWNRVVMTPATSGDI
jgi:hypothetical protein